MTFYCHTGCSQDEVAAALSSLGLWSSRFTGSRRPRHRRPPVIRKPAPDTRRVDVAFYDYTDEAGKLEYQVVRTEPKGFRQRRPDGNGGWINSLYKHIDGEKVLAVRPLLYRLKDVIENETVFIVEGEKDCETLRSHGFVATTNSQGRARGMPGLTPGSLRRMYLSCRTGMRLATSERGKST